MPLVVLGMKERIGTKRMTRSRNLVPFIQVLERLLEFSLLTLVLLLVFGWPVPSSGRGFFDAFLRTSSATFFFYLVSGYALTSTLLSTSWRLRNAWLHAALITIAFLASTLAFVLLSSFSIIENIGKGAVLGSMVVFLVNLAGSKLISALGAK